MTLVPLGARLCPDVRVSSATTIVHRYTLPPTGVSGASGGSTARFLSLISQTDPASHHAVIGRTRFVGLRFLFGSRLLFCFFGRASHFVFCNIDLGELVSFRGDGR